MNSARDVGIIRTYQRIAKIPGVLGENIVLNVKAKSTQVLDRENGRCARVALTKGVDLPQIRHKPHDVKNRFLR